MANIINYLKHIRLEFRRSSSRMTMFILGIVLFGIIGLFVLQSALRNTEAANAILETQALALEQENAQYAANISGLGTVQGVEQIARDELGLVDPDTVLIQPGD